MGNVDGVRLPSTDDDDAVALDAAAPGPVKAPPYQALFPDLDHMSRSSFEKGTVSRRRITRALVILASVPVVVVAVILIPQLLRS